MPIKNRFSLFAQRVLALLCSGAMILSLLGGGDLMPSVVKADVAADVVLPQGSLAELAGRDELRGAVAFVVGEALALSGGVISMIDEEDRNVAAWVDPQTGRAYAPLRFVATALQAEVSWQQEAQQVELTQGGHHIVMKIGETQIERDGEQIDSDAAPQLIGSRVYLPLRALAQALGLEIHYQDSLVVLQEAKALQSLKTDHEATLRLLALKLRPLARLNSYANLELLLENSFGNEYGYMNGYVVTTSEGIDMAQESEAPMAMATPADARATNEASAAPSAGTGESAKAEADYSKTNTQVEGIDEADIVKTDGTHLYLIHSDQAVIVQAMPAEAMQVTARVRFDGALEPQELFIEDNRLVVIGQKYRDLPEGFVVEKDTTETEMMKIAPRRGYYYQSGMTMTQVLIYDISDRAKPELQRTVEIEGNYVSSRRIGSSYYVVANKSFSWFGIQNGYEAPQPYCFDSSVPTSEEPLAVPYENISCFPDFQSSNYLMVAAFDADQNVPADIQAYLGAGETLYVSPQNLYIAMSQYQYRPIEPLVVEDGALVGKPYYSWEDTTRVFRFALTTGTLEYQAGGDVPGTLLNQFSMDEHQGYLRLATNRSGSWTPSGSTEMRNQLYVLDDQLKTVGRIENIAPGEKIYSARFMGDRAFMVTFRTVDPLFVIDLKTPTAPKILGELKIPGYSDYLHPLDENHLIGFGKDAIAIPYKDAQGRILGENAYYLGMKLSLFDVTDLANPKETAMVVIGDRGTESSLLHNHKALLFNAQTRMLAFPLHESKVLDGELMQGSYPSYGTPVFDGLVVYHIDPALGSDGIQELGRITQQTNKVDAKRGLTVDYQRSIERGLYIGRTIYTLSPGAVQANSLDTFEVLGSVNLKNGN